MRKYSLYSVIIISVALLSAPAVAQCLPGMPCVVPKDSGQNAPKSDSAACDADFMNQIYAHAFMEAQRETITAETILRKPDSVLEYSCFDRMASQVAYLANPLFSFSDLWHTQNVPIGGTIDNDQHDQTTIDVYMDDGYIGHSIEELVLSVLKAPDGNYIDANFWHTFLGGGSTLNNNIVPAVIGGAYDCQFMDNVYPLAKCRNFGEDDPFFSFDWLTANDPRALPAPCTNGTQILPGYIPLANNDGRAYVNFDNASPTYLDRLRAPAPNCSAPVPTGVQTRYVRKTVDPQGNVTTHPPVVYENKVCPNPSCYYDHGSNTCRP